MHPHLFIFWICLRQEASNKTFKASDISIGIDVQSIIAKKGPKENSQIHLLHRNTKFVGQYTNSTQLESQLSTEISMYQTQN